MSLYERIVAYYPDLTDADFRPGGTIIIRNDSDGLGEYIASWTNQKHEHPPFGFDPHIKVGERNETVH